jgi:hypothetical protein
MRMPDTKIKNAFTAFYNSEYRKIRGQWRKWISDRIAELQKPADAFFDEVFKLVFDEKGRPTYLSRLKF